MEKFARGQGGVHTGADIVGGHSPELWVVSRHLVRQRKLMVFVLIHLHKDA